MCYILETAVELNESILTICGRCATLSVVILSIVDAMSVERSQCFRLPLSLLLMAHL